ncbi:MAG TPA: carboxypeptidase regulatory-like domain-containing protein [Bryobacteraceae bacterium]|nr:carboxypeptidase regulatory-like domain-containing protein [Bryobacteraceae bacterium]
MRAPRALFAIASFLACTAPHLAAYERMIYRGIPLSRAPSIAFTAGPSVVAGLKNADGGTVITAESDPIAALEGAIGAWNSIPGTSINFSFRPSATPVVVNPGDGANVFSFEDDLASRSVSDSAIAITMVRYTSSGVIIDSDILFNPLARFSTIPTLNSYDLQSIAAHELGHTLGADHSFLPAATMFAYSMPETISERHLSSDDIAFAAAAYPQDASKVGGIRGTVAYASGTLIDGALVLVCTRAADVVVGVTTRSDGAFRVGGLPPGEYLVFAYPVAPYLGGNASGDGAFDVPDWQPAFYGFGDEPRPVTVAGGQNNATADITVPAGSAQFAVQSSMVGDSFLFAGVLAADHATEVLVEAKGIPETFRPEDLLIYGSGVTLQPDSIASVPADKPGEPGLLWFTVNVGPQAGWSEVVLALSHEGRISPLGNFRVQPSGPQFTPRGVVSGASFFEGALAPGEIVSLFGTGIGPVEPAQGTFDTAGKLATAAGGVTVEFDGRPAPLFYADSAQINAQVPFEVSGRASTVVRVRYGDTAAEAVLPVAAARPEIFGTRDQVCVYDEHGIANDPDHPARRGSVIVAYGTGQGLVQPALATGAPGGSDPLNRARITATLGGVAAPVEFAGMAPGYVGLLQLNIKVPDNVPAGDSMELRLTSDGISNEMPVYIAVR